MDEDSSIQAQEDLQKASEALSGASSLFWTAQAELIRTIPANKDAQQLRFTADVLAKAQDEWVNLANALFAFSAAFKAIPAPDAEKENKRCRILRQRAQTLATRFEHLISDDFAEQVRWIEWQSNKRNNDRRLVITSQPIEVGPFLQKTLFNNRTVIGASATLKVAGSFDFVANQLGLTDNYTGLDVGTNFDYTTQALGFVPNIAAPEYRSNAQWEAQIVPVIEGLLQASAGRALVLFTSKKQLDRVHSELAGKLPYTVLKQGDATQSELVRRFKSDVHSVLFATRTWFTGINVEGEALSLVIIDKLPFPSTSDPVVEATCEAIDKKFGERASFMRYSIPTASAILEQGVGRLIRTHSDRGVWAILDSRLNSKGYGAKLKSGLLPGSPRTGSLADVTRFFSEGK